MHKKTKLEGKHTVDNITDFSSCEQTIRRSCARVANRYEHLALFVYASSMDMLGSAYIYIYIYIYFCCLYSYPFWLKLSFPQSFCSLSFCSLSEVSCSRGMSLRMSSLRMRFVPSCRLRLSGLGTYTPLSGMRSVPSCDGSALYVFLMYVLFIRGVTIFHTRPRAG